jgi:hypothetical protein
VPVEGTFFKRRQMTSIEVGITDPARELAHLGRHFQESTHGRKTIEALAKSIGLGIDSADFLEVLAAIQRRINALESLVDEVTDEHFDQDQKNLVRTATSNFRSLLHPQHAVNSWEGNLKQFLPEKNITALTMFGSIARRIRPLRVIPDEDREEAIRKIDETAAALEDDGLEPWMKPLLVSSLARLSLTLKYFRFFGHDAAILALIYAQQNIATVQTVVGPEKGRRSLKDAALIVSLIGNLFLLPQQATDAALVYRGWSHHVLEVLFANTPTPPEQLLLSGPAAIKPDEPVVDELVVQQQ